MNNKENLKDRELDRETLNKVSGGIHIKYAGVDDASTSIQDSHHDDSKDDDDVRGRV